MRLPFYSSYYVCQTIHNVYVFQNYTKLQFVFIFKIISVVQKRTYIRGWFIYDKYDNWKGDDYIN